MRLFNAASLFLILLSAAIVAGCTAPSPGATIEGGLETGLTAGKVADRTENGLLSANIGDDSHSVNIALLLPLSGPEAETGSALLKAATMALFDAYNPSLVLRPYDTRGTATGAEEATHQALLDRPQIILGPLLSENVTVAGEVIAGSGVPLIGFSSDSDAAAPGQYIFGFRPEEEVGRIIRYAATSGHETFAGLAPFGRYGSRVGKAFHDTILETETELVALERYQPDPDAFSEPVKILADYDKRRKAYRDEVDFLKSLQDDLTDELVEALKNQEVIGELEFGAVLVPEGGEMLRGLAPLLPFYEIDPDKIKLLGTGLWNDPTLRREPTLQGAWFVAPDPQSVAEFTKRYTDTYGKKPPRIATLGYDALSFVASLVVEARENKRPAFTRDQLERAEGFIGVDGPFRFLPNGISERLLAVLEIQKNEFILVDPAPERFPSLDYAVKEAGAPRPR